MLLHYCISNEVSCVSCLEEGKVKFVAAGGWNGKVCIWGDGPKEHELVEHSTRGHTDDVICMTFFPPNCFATGGYDGKVIVWKVDGMVRCVLQTSTNELKEELCNPITSLLHLPKEKILSGVSAHGYFYFWRVPEPKAVLEFSLGHPAQPGPLCVDSSSQVSMIFIDEKRLLLTASIYFTCRLWTETGVKIGQFGQANAWSIQIPESWASKSPTYVTSIPSVQDLESISSTRSSSRIDTSAGTSGNRSNNSRQTSREVLNTTPMEVTMPKDLLPVRKSESSDKTIKGNAMENERYPYPNIANALDGGPPHLRLNSWFKALQLAYNRKLPMKDLTAFGAVLPPNVSFIRKKWSQESCTALAAGTVCHRKKSRVQDSPPRLALPHFRVNHTALTFSTIKSETSSGKSVSSLGDCRV